MVSSIAIPDAEKTVVLELTVKEAMALGSGIHFREQPQTAAQARRKIRASLEQLMIPGSERLFYHAIDL